MTSIQILFLCCFAATVMAGGDLEIKKFFIQQAVECSKEHPVTSGELEMMKQHKIPDNKTAKCLTACVLKRTKWINDKGMFDEDKAYQLSEKEYPGDQAKLANAKKLYSTCMKVNKEPVSDGELGCERSVLLTACLTEHAPKLGFVIQ